MSVEKFSADVLNELNELKKLGVTVPASAIARAKNLEEMEDYNDMSVSECADLLISLG